MAIQLKYIKENREHQHTLDKAFNGKIVPVNRYVNDEAIINYGCMVCGTTFFQKPKYLLETDNEYNHFCILKKAT